ncbi:MAG: EAL domain-containing protein [Fulvimarina manganoxydans]|uniref:putative bifunctional diguanylate cyclase/phosphodiesterase n=1 Tax=Fulvimarina manganoxydans TaxID=937218 RepID=UPI00235441C6|nr:EAL domain-containing protein [Fulvimarina manganoxydans]MCK5932107.1 EAL domain-containing protein [Fulvimarina manganoxydans]
MMTAYPNPAHVVPDGDAQEVTLLKIALRNSIPGLVVNLAASCGIGGLFALYGHEWAWFWLGLVCVLTVFRVFICMRIQRWLRETPAPRPLAACQAQNVLAAGLISGAASWGLFGWLALAVPEVSLHYTTCIIISGLAAGALVVLSPYRWTGPAYIWVMTTPCIVRLSLNGGSDELLSVLCFVFMVVMTLAHRSSARVLRDAIDLGRQNAKLVEEMRRNNLYLEERVAQRTRSLHELAHRDQLTGLLNRRGLTVAFDAWVADGGAPAVLLFLDLDHFKQINDGLGHEAGDLVLSEVARRLSQSCGEQAIALARWGGDEFICLLRPGTTGDLRHAADRLAASVAAACGAPFHIAGAQCQPMASIGVALYPEGGGDLNQLVRRADHAGGEAKRRGRGRFVHYDRALSITMQRQMTIFADFESAMAKGEITIAYQPVVDTARGIVTAYHSRLDWKHPELGVVEPHESIEVAEANEMIGRVGHVFFDTALEDAATWQSLGSPARLAVDVSVRQLLAEGFVDQTLSIVQKHGLEPSSLEIGVVAAAFAPEDEAGTMAVLRALRAEGVVVTLSEFGSGLIRLSRLKDYPIDRLKIDPVLITAGDRPSQAVVEGLIHMARHLDLEVIVTSVETLDQARSAVALGIDALQGDVIRHPARLEAALQPVETPWLDGRSQTPDPSEIAA